MFLPIGDYKDPIAEVQREISAMYKVRVGSWKSKFVKMVIEDTQDNTFIHSKDAVRKTLRHFGMKKVIQ